jgi:glycosyltransferase involved in cell wall biosynthesis
MSLISVIISTYNHASFIKTTIESVLNQTHKELEIIISDDSSSDGTQNILKDYSKTYPTLIKLSLSKKNLGIPSNLNNGLRLASGEFIAWLGGDDIMFPQKLENQIRLMNNNRNCVLCHHDAIVFQSDPYKEIGLFSDIYGPGKGKYKSTSVDILFDPKMRMFPSSFLVRRYACPPQGHDIRLGPLSEWLFDIEVATKGEIQFIDEVLGAYRRHSSNITNFNSKMHESSLRDSLMCLSIVDKKYPKLKSLGNRSRKFVYLKEAVKAFVRGNKKLALKLCKELIREGDYIKGSLLYFLFLISNTRFFNRMINKPYSGKLRRMLL